MCGEAMAKMQKRSDMMARVNTEVAQLWGDQLQKPAYTRGRIKRYIENWIYELETTETLSSLHCAEIRGEIIGVVRTLKLPVRWYFQLSCLCGYDFGEICRCMRWSEATCERRHRDLINGLCARLCNCTEYYVERDMMPRAIYELSGVGDEVGCGEVVASKR